MEVALVSEPNRAPFPPLFVIGLPRVGSTLVYHALARRYRMAYICNAAAAFPSCPALVTSMLCRVARVSPGSVFVNRYGVTPGWSGPSQAGRVWARWFPRDQRYVDPESVDDEAISAMRGSIARIESAFDAPFVNKAQGHALRIEALSKVFPNALFVRIGRERLEVAESILRGRRECFGTDHHWFSAKPHDFKLIASLDPMGQIAAQIRGIERDMDMAVDRVGSLRVVDVHYRQFCAAPHRTLEGIRDIYERATGRRLGIRDEVPQAFPLHQRERVTSAESRMLRAAVESAGLDPRHPSARAD